MWAPFRRVVSYLDSTSNHNWFWNQPHRGLLYHIWILHQTTTTNDGQCGCIRCIIFGFYIKPQPFNVTASYPIGCIIFGFYIKPQQLFEPVFNALCCIIFGFYIKPQLCTDKQCPIRSCIIFGFYIKPQPSSEYRFHNTCCIIFGFYIKPQLVAAPLRKEPVVSYLDSTSNHNNITSIAIWTGVVSYLDSTSNHNPLLRRCQRRYVVSYLDSTSNHNIKAFAQMLKVLYHIWILHQTTTHSCIISPVKSLYHIWILHQTTTQIRVFCQGNRCIIFGFYIKPQHLRGYLVEEIVVSYLDSTSNHNVGQVLAWQTDRYRDCT